MAEKKCTADEKKNKNGTGQKNIKKIWALRALRALKNKNKL